MTTYINLDCLNCHTETSLNVTKDTILCEYCGAVYNIKIEPNLIEPRNIEISLTGTYGYSTKKK